MIKTPGDLGDPKALAQLKTPKLWQNHTCVRGDQVGMIINIFPTTSWDQGSKSIPKSSEVKTGSAVFQRT